MFTSIVLCLIFLKAKARHNWNKDAASFFLFMTQYIKTSVNLTLKLYGG